MPVIKLEQILEEAEACRQQLPPMPFSPQMPQGREIARWIDHTLLKPEATAEQIMRLCTEAKEYGFASVCVNPGYVPLAAGLLKGTETKICAVVSFPLGAHLPKQKAAETLSVLQAGADEVDMVMNIGAMKGEAYVLVWKDIQAVCEAAHDNGALVKVILETALLTRGEKILASLIAKYGGADFVKTSTGFASGGAAVEDVELMRRVVGAEIGVKAAGGIRTLADARAMISAGATRIGASAGVAILKEAVEE